MESESQLITSRVQELPADRKQAAEAFVGHPLRPEQLVVFMVVEPGVEPSPETRARSRARLEKLFERIDERTAGRNIDPDQADAVIDVAVAAVRSGKV